VTAPLPDLARAAEAIARRGGDLGRPLHVLGETTSTNDEAKRAGKLGAPHGSVWIAERQTAGRGRQGRLWESPGGENLLFSVLLRHAGSPARLPLVALVAGLAVAEAVSRAAPSATLQIKWPNDVVVPSEGGGLRKVAGVLVETSIAGSVADAIVVGIGVNVHTRVFPDHLAPIATSVACLAEGPPPERAEILADILEGLGRDAPFVLARGLGIVHARLARRDALLGRAVRSERGAGVARGIDGEGRLLVEGPEGVRIPWNAGEVHLEGGAPEASTARPEAG
jgi:BirA family biotin operon repressor/biotin-[acetyl-CoA-carboxylase] ligase